MTFGETAWRERDAQVLDWESRKSAGEEISDNVQLFLGTAYWDRHALHQVSPKAGDNPEEVQDS